MRSEKTIMRLAERKVFGSDWKVITKEEAEAFEKDGNGDIHVIQKTKEDGTPYYCKVDTNGLDYEDIQLELQMRQESHLKTIKILAVTYFILAIVAAIIVAVNYEKFFESLARIV